jgi:hypothetical protein
MKKIFLLLLTVVLTSCAGQVGAYKAESWAYKSNLKPGFRFYVDDISVDRMGLSFSVKDEVKNLLPLVLLDAGCFVTGDREGADFVIRVSLTEREFSVGWNTRRSVCVDVSILAVEGGESTTEATPCAAARVAAISRDGFSSSFIVEKYLEKCLKKAVRALKKSDAVAR